MEIDDIKRWKVDDLRKYLRERGQPIGAKRKDELVALVYAVAKLDLPIIPNKNDVKDQLDFDYEALLQVTVGQVKFNLPDPWSLDDWIPEDSGINKWPPCMYVNIAEYLVDHDQRCLLTRLSNDYKEGKAFSYFASSESWIQEVFYHPVAADHPLCFLKSRCTPSQNVRRIQHKLWVALEKSTGSVKSAYCSCFAGLGSTCNHVAALLFKIDYAWQQGLTSNCQKACTSVANKWISPSLSTVGPMRTRDMVFAKPHYTRKIRPVDVDIKARKQFVPHCDPRETPTIEKLVQALYPEHPHAAAFQYTLPEPVPQYDPSSEVNVTVEEECLTSESMPEPLYICAARCGDAFSTSLPTYSLEQCRLIEQATVSQAECQLWFDHRRGRISASAAHRVLSKMRTLETKQADCSKLVSSIIGADNGHDSQLNVPSLRYGRDNEPLAVDTYLRQQKGLHSNLVVSKCGLFIIPDSVHLCASPDRLVDCECCGSGLLEVKCPSSSADCDLTESDLPYLYKDNGNLRLKTSHSYYTQVQMQMGVTRRTFCDFFVYSPTGSICERIYFDQDFFAALCIACTQFFNVFVAPVLSAAVFC